MKTITLTHGAEFRLGVRIFRVSGARAVEVPQVFGRPLTGAEATADARTFSALPALERSDRVTVDGRLCRVSVRGGAVSFVPVTE